ncbi:MAG: hypothetical protein WC313_05510 [Candidatus Kapaibacterium sp.]|jgi:hypothetical protein|nr:hypothetical protein [Candidatus Kapabacteria bacterium]
MSEQILMDQVGKREKHANQGIVTVYLRSVGLKSGNPYCAAGQYYCYAEACNRLGLKETYIPFKKTGLSREIYNDAAKKGKRVDYSPAKHDFIIWRLKGNSWRGHIERIIKVCDKGWVLTVGFNVAMDDGGEGVAIKKRNIYHPVGRLIIYGLVGFGG